MDNILGLLVQRDFIPDNLKQQLLFIVSLLAVYLVQLSIYVTLSITRPVLDCLYIVYAQIKPDVYSTLVATLPSTCEDLFFLILHTLDVTATTLWSWPQVPSQDEPVSMVSAIKLAYKTVRGHSISSGDARKLYLWLPDTMSRRLTSRECYHRSLSHISGIPIFKLPFVVDVLLSKKNSGQSLDYVLARLPNAVSSLVNDEICEEIYSRHATALATIVVSLGFIFFIFSLFELRNHIFSILTNGLVALRHYVLFPIRFLVNRYQRAQQTADVSGSSRAQTEAQPELGSVSAVQSVQTDEIIPIDDGEKSPEQRSQDSTCPTDSIQDESSAEDVIPAEGSPTITHSEEAGRVEEPALTTHDAKNTPETVTVTVEEPRSAPSNLQKIQVYTEERSTPSDLQQIQVYTGTTPSRPPKISAKRVSSSLEHGPSTNMFVPRMPSQWNALTKQWAQNNVHASNFNSTSTQLAQRGAMLGLRGNQRQTATPGSFFLAGTSQASPIPQYFDPYGVSPGLHAYTTLQQQSPSNGPSNAYVEPTRRNIIYDSNISLARRNQEQLSPSGPSTCKNDERDAVESATKTAPSAINESEPDGLKQTAVVVEVHPPPSNTITTVQSSTATESSAETGPVSGVIGQLLEDEIFVYPGDSNANTLQAAPEAEFPTQFSTQDELIKKVDSANNVIPVSTVDNSRPSPEIRHAEDKVLPTFKSTEFTFNVSELSRASSVPSVPADSNGGVWSSIHAPTRTLTPETASFQLTGLAASMHGPKSHARALGDASHESETSKLDRNPSDGLKASIHAPADDTNLFDDSTRRSMHAPDPEDQSLEEAYHHMKASKSKPGKNKKKKRR